MTNAEISDDRVVVPFDHHSEEFRDNGTEILRDMRSRCPVSWSDAHGGYWVVTSYDAVAQAARDWETFSSWKDVPLGDSPRRGATMPDAHPESRQGFSEMDGDMHRAIRQPLAPYFAPRAAEELRTEIRAYTDWCIDHFIEQGSADLVNDLASPVPAMWAMDSLGLPMRDWRRFADAAHKAFYILPGTPEHDALAGTRAWMNGELDQAIRDRRETPRTDLLSVVANLRVDGELLDFVDAFGTAQLLLHGGTDTTTNLLAGTFVHLSENPDARAWLAEDYGRLDNACEEYLRVFSPVQGLARTVTKPCTLAGQKLQTNDRVWLAWAGANFDPEEFEDPDTIKLDRVANRHASFALGPHRCLGSAVARTIWKVVVVAVLERIGDFKVDRTRAQRYPTIGVMNGWQTIPATFTPGRPLGVEVDALSGLSLGSEVGE